MVRASPIARPKKAPRRNPSAATATWRAGRIGAELVIDGEVAVTLFLNGTAWRATGDVSAWDYRREVVVEAVNEACREAGIKVTNRPPEEPAGAKRANPRRRNPETVFCPKCSGTKAGGYIPQYKHVEGGVCFLCQGKGTVTEKQASRWYAAQMKQDLPKGSAGYAPASKTTRKALTKEQVDVVMRSIDSRSPIHNKDGAAIVIAKKSGGGAHDGPYFVMEIYGARTGEYVGGDVYFEGAPGAWKVFAISDGLKPYTTPAKMQAALNAIQRPAKGNPRKRKAPARRR